MSVDGTLVGAVVIVVLAGASLFDLHRVEVGSITVYTTPALRDLLEKGLFPAWRAQGGMSIEPVYVAAGQQYNRLRMSGAEPEADLFIHASPLFIQKGFDEGYMLSVQPEPEPHLAAGFGSEAGDGRFSWTAFAWSPLVEVYSTRLAASPDLANASMRYGLAHPTLSNNGIYTVLFLEEVSPEAGEHARSRTVVQPVNARANIMGIADGSFDVTLGYEAVAQFFERQGARIQWDVPLVGGERATTPVLFCVGLVDGPHTEEARDFIDFIYTDASQETVREFHFRSIRDPVRENESEDVRVVTFNWQDWKAIEAKLPMYEVMHRAEQRRL